MSKHIAQLIHLATHPGGCTLCCISDSKMEQVEVKILEKMAAMNG